MSSCSSNVAKHRHQEGGHFQLGCPHGVRRIAPMGLCHDDQFLLRAQQHLLLYLGLVLVHWRTWSPQTKLWSEFFVEFELYPDKHLRRLSKGEAGEPF
uniref:Uncharacterized protein n=1 Tax=Cannabis sativa TaxID=3483 RepID=A0A803QGH9_CANSA